MARIIDKIHARRKEFKAERDAITTAAANLLDADEPSIHPGWHHSFEFFPPKTEPGLDNLLTRIDRMSRRLDPLFVSVTWGADGSTLSRTLAVASHVQRFSCVDVLLHLSCTGLSHERIRMVLDMAKGAGVRNVLALRGDPPRGKARGWGPGDVSGGECDRAIDLVKLIRDLHGDAFGIGVAGHPEGHPSSMSGEEGRRTEMRHLKEKLDAGADFVITQFFYDANVFLEYVARCREAGITCPIIPGIMPIQSYASLVKMTQFCGISVPSSVMARLGRVRHDDEAVKKIGCEIATEMCREILLSASQRSKEQQNGDEYLHVDGFHFYTLNLERSTTRILAELGAVDVVKGERRRQDRGDGNEGTADAEDDNQNGSGSGTGGRGASVSEHARTARRVLPWKPSAMENRSREDVRPINWSNRPKSYVMRTDDWDEYPNGRWGDSTSPAFGELSDLSHFYSFTLGSDDDRRAMLGNCPLAESDVHEVFARYVEGTVPHIPWCETPLHPESFLFQLRLARLNRCGFLTVNSQPPVDGVPSDHPAYGWGGRGGRVYQKAYVECFVSPDNADRLARMARDDPNLNLHAVTGSGRELRVGVEEGGVTALTWGAFPNREILQPTVFDPDTFLVWAEEAFSLWSAMWSNLYDYGSESHELIERIKDTYYLVAIIDNDFAGGGEDGSTFPLLDALLKIGEESSS